MPQPPRQIPGYYYDAEKGKYFKIERAGTAPTTAAWSADNVKRRRLEDRQAVAREQQAQRNRGRVRRATALSRATAGGGSLVRELSGRVGLDVVPASFADGLVGKGSLPLADAARWSGGGSGGMRRNVQNMYVDGQDIKTGACVAFATIDGDSLISTYIPRDRNGRVHRRLLAEYYNSSAHGAPSQELTVSQISDIKCHQPSNQILVTSRSPGPDVALWAFTPKVTAPDDPRPNWLLSGNASSVYKCIRTPGRGGNSSFTSALYQANTVTSAPQGSNLLGLIGTNSGIVQWHDGSATTSWWTPPSLPRLDDTSTTFGGNNNNIKSPSNPFRDVFAIDFQAGQPQVALFGGRPGTLWVGDTRAPAETWDSVAVQSSITHLRSVGGGGGHQVLVAGLRNTLALYDLRFRKSERNHQGHDNANSTQLARHHRGGGANRHGKRSNNKYNNRYANSFNDGGGSGPLKNADRPVLRFREYRNAAHVDIGFDFDAGSGVVAAAHDDGRVALYSVRTGHRLLSPLPSSSSSSGDINQIYSERGPVQSIQWQSFPGDHVSSLFVGVQSDVGVYSFGVRDFEDEA